MLLELRNFGLVHLRDALKRILYAQFVIFFLAHRVIGEDIERFEVLESADKVAQPVQVIRIVRDAGHNDMANPDFHIFAVKVFCKGEDTVVWLF